MSTMGGTGVAKGPVFYIEDIPVFYFPVVPVPVNQERQTGFLLPTVGYSNQYWSRGEDSLLLGHLQGDGFDPLS